MNLLLKHITLIYLVLKAKIVASGSFRLFGKRVKYNDSKAFYGMYNELIRNEIYQFKTSNPNPIIIDCGANIGLSVLYFNQLVPNAKIHAFEPDTNILKLLYENTNHISEFVHIYPKAVWNENTFLEFGMEGADMSSIYSKKNTTTVEAIKTSEFLEQFNEIELLKIDIEGAELEVIKDCSIHLSKIKYVFIEYHSYPNQTQHLSEILSIMKENGFRHQILPSRREKFPFMPQNERTFDVLLNLFFTKTIPNEFI